MPEPLQLILEAASVWGNRVLVVVLVIALLGNWWLWRADSARPTGQRLKRVGTSWWSLVLVLAGIGFYLLNVQLAPMTGALATLHATTDAEVPSISFRRLADDTPHELRDFRGSVVVLNLWATWCPPCLEEMPTLDRLHASYEDQGLVVIALSDEPRDRLLSFFEEHPVQLVSAYAERFDWLKIETFRPFTLIIDRAGILRRHLLGTRSYKEFEAAIRPYL